MVFEEKYLCTIHTQINLFQFFLLDSQLLLLSFYFSSHTYTGPFKVFNEKDEEAVLRKFVAHIQELKPHVIVTYNGDKFDWPYVETRCKKYTYLNLYSHLGIRSTAQPAATGEFILCDFMCTWYP